MKIQGKLIALVVGSQLLMAGALALYLLVTAPIERLQKDNSYFQQAAQAAEVLQGEAAKLTIMPIVDQYAALKASLAAYQAAVEKVGTLESLAAVSEVTANAVTSVGKLSGMTQDSFQKISKAAEDLIGDIERLQLSQREITLLVISNKANEAGLDEQLRNIAQFHLSTLFLQLRRGTDALILTASLIREQDGLIAAEIAGIKARSTLMATGVMGVVFILVSGISLLMARRIARSLRLLSAGVAVMGTGDLTKRFNLARRDEIGRLGRDLDQLQDSLKSSIEQIQAASGHNRELRLELLQVVSESSSSATEIEANSASIRTQMERMDRMAGMAVQESGTAVELMSGFRGRLDAQNQHVEGTVAAVTQMLASIENIDRITARDRQAAENLVLQSERSREVFEDAFEKVAEITDSVSAIQEMAAVIAGIASQTNILAMNAAIEAAHAGDFGKGFAVVADEIGKLATASALSSDEIAQTIKTIVAKMHEAGSTREGTGAAFNGISAGIRQVSDSIGEIYGNVNEMSTGSRQILSAMESLRGTSGDITGQSARIEEIARSTQATLGDLGRISHEVTSNISEISVGIQTITQSIRTVSGHGERLSAIGDQLETAVAAFTTEAGE